MRHQEPREAYSSQILAGLPVRASFWQARARSLRQENEDPSGESVAYRAGIRIDSLEIVPFGAPLRVEASGTWVP